MKRITFFHNNVLVVLRKCCIFAKYLHYNMIKVTVKDNDLRAAAAQGMDEFVGVFVTAINNAIGGQLTAENMAQLNADQVTLLAYITLRDEMMDGGMVQLIHNGYGPFIFQNPFARVMKVWGVNDLGKLIYNANKLYRQHHEAIERDCSEDEFMALFEKFPCFDDIDDSFVENEERFTAQIAEYIDNNIEKFAEIEQ